MLECDCFIFFIFHLFIIIIIINIIIISYDILSIFGFVAYRYYQHLCARVQWLTHGIADKFKL
jgi:hypothetical protein